MAKFVTRTTKSTECKVMVCDTENRTVSTTICFIPGVYKDFNKGGDGFDACQTIPNWKTTEVVVSVLDWAIRSEKRRMSMADWLAYSEPCNDDEPEEDEEE